MSRESLYRPLIERPEFPSKDLVDVLSGASTLIVFVALSSPGRSRVGVRTCGRLRKVARDGEIYEVFYDFRASPVARALSLMRRVGGFRYNVRSCALNRAKYVH